MGPANPHAGLCFELLAKSGTCTPHTARCDVPSNALRGWVTVRRTCGLQGWQRTRHAALHIAPAPAHLSKLSNAQCAKVCKQRTSWMNSSRCLTFLSTMACTTGTLRLASSTWITGPAKAHVSKARKQARQMCTGLAKQQTAAHLPIHLNPFCMHAYVANPEITAGPHHYKQG